MQLTITNLSKTYPNGVRALQNVSLTIEPGIDGLFELQILDAVGREVLRTSINGRTVIETSDLSNGNYILHLTGDGLLATERFSVVR